MKVQVEDRLAGVVARVAGEAVAGRLTPISRATRVAAVTSRPSAGSCLASASRADGRCTWGTTKKWTGPILTGWSFGMSKQTTRSSWYSTFARTVPSTIRQSKHSDTRQLPDATGSPAIYHRGTPSVMAASQLP